MAKRRRLEWEAKKAEHGIEELKEKMAFDMLEGEENESRNDIRRSLNELMFKRHEIEEEIGECSTCTLSHHDHSGEEEMSTCGLNENCPVQLAGKLCGCLNC